MTNHQGACELSRFATMFIAFLLPDELRLDPPKVESQTGGDPLEGFAGATNADE